MAGSVSGKNNLMNSIMWQPSKDYAKNSQMTAYIEYVNDNMTLTESMQIKTLMKQHILLEKVKYE